MTLLQLGGALRAGILSAIKLPVISNYAFDYDANTLDVGTIETWPKIGGDVGVDLTHRSTLPTVISSAINGYKSVSMNGQAMDGSFTMPGVNTIFIVMKMVLPLGGAASSDCVFDGANAATSLFVIDSTPQSEMYGGSALSYNVAVANGVYNYITVQFNGSSSLLRSQGVQRAFGDAGGTDMGGLTLGGLGSGGSRGVNFECARIIGYSRALTTLEIGKVETYLAKKYAL